MTNRSRSSSSGAAPVPALENDSTIEALNLNPTAKAAAHQLKRRFPSVVFTSGRRDRASQASAMASNAALNRKWIQQSYVVSEASIACQRWVDQNPNAKTKAAIMPGLLEVLNRFSDEQLSHLSKHLSGDAFDVQPVTQNADAIKQMLRTLTQQAGGKFLEREGGLVRWHAQF